MWAESFQARGKQITAMHNNRIGGRSFPPLNKKTLIKSSILSWWKQRRFSSTMSTSDSFTNFMGSLGQGFCYFLPLCHLLLGAGDWQIHLPCIFNAFWVVQIATNHSPEQIGNTAEKWVYHGRPLQCLLFVLSEWCLVCSYHSPWGWNSNISRELTTDVPVWALFLFVGWFLKFFKFIFKHWIFSLLFHCL